MAKKKIYEINRKEYDKIRKMDHKHQNYYHSYTGKHWGDAINYDLCINSACYGIEESVELIERLINRQAKNKSKKEDKQ